MQIAVSVVLPSPVIPICCCLGTVNAHWSRDLNMPAGGEKPSALKNLVPKRCLGAPHSFHKHRVTCDWQSACQGVVSSWELRLGDGEGGAKCGFLAGNSDCSAVRVDDEHRSLFKLLAGSSLHLGRTSQSAGCTAGCSQWLPSSYTCVPSVQL